MRDRLRAGFYALRQRLVAALVDAVYAPIRQRMEEERRRDGPRRPKVGDFVYVLKLSEGDHGFRRTPHLALVTRVTGFDSRERLDVEVLAPRIGEMLNVPRKGSSTDNLYIEPAVWMPLEEVP